MTSERYKSYLAATRLLKAAVELGDADRETLRDAAEGLLLTRGGREDDALALVVGAQVVLNQLMVRGVWDGEREELFFKTLMACGPRSIRSRPAYATRSPESGDMAALGRHMRD